MDGPDDGGRRLPDGTSKCWRSARIRQEGRIFPFLVEDITPRELRVPGSPATKHPNGATGIFGIDISAPDVQRAANSLAVLTDNEDPVSPGACVLSPVKDEAATGPCPHAVELVGRQSAASRELDPVLAHGVRLRARAG